MIKGWFKKAEAVCVLLTIIALTINLFRIPVSDWLMLVAFLSLSLVYLIAAYSAKQKLFNSRMPIHLETTSAFPKILVMVSFLCLSILLIGMLFHFLNFAGADNQLMIGSTAGIFMLILNAIVLRDTFPEVYQFLYARLIPLVVVGLLIYFRKF